MRFAIFGCGGFGRELLGPARQLHSQRLIQKAEHEVVFVADEPSQDVFGAKVILPEALTHDDELIIAIGDPGVRRTLAKRFSNIPAGKLIAPTAVIGPGALVGEGAVFCDFTMATADARIGRHFQCNIYSYVAHDCVIGDFVTFAPRVSCNGNVQVEDGAYIGTGAVIKQGSRGNPLVIGAGAVVGMGAVVTKNVPEGATVVGNPARVRE